MSKASNACGKAASYEDKMRKEFHNWELDFEPDNDRRPSKFEIWKACAAIKDAEIAELKEQAAESRMIGVEQGRHEYLNEIASRDLMIKELREAAKHFINTSYTKDMDAYDAIMEALAKSEHHNSRALEKMLLEAELKGLTDYRVGKFFIAERAKELQAELAELNKE